MLPLIGHRGKDKSLGMENTSVIAGSGVVVADTGTREGLEVIELLCILILVVVT